MMAFALMDFYEGVKNDPRIFKWIAVYSFADLDGKYYEKFYPLHECTQEDFAKFHPPDFKTRPKIETYKQ